MGPKRSGRPASKASAANTTDASSASGWVGVFWVLAATLLAHWSMVTRDFVFDDTLIIADLQRRGAWRLFEVDTFGFVRPGKCFLMSALNGAFGLRPLLWQSFCLGVLLVLAVAVLRFARLLLPGTAALAAALIYAVHPLHVEGAGWASAVNGSVMALCAVLYYTLWIQASNRLKTSDLAGLTILFCWAIFMKEEAVVLPVVAALISWLRREPLSRRARSLLAVQLGIGLVFALFNRYLARQCNQTLESLPFPKWLCSLNAPAIMLDHAGHFFFPFRWRFFDMYEPRSSTFFTGLLAGLVGAIIIGFTLWRWRDRQRFPVFCVLFYVAAFLPVSNIIPFGNNFFGVRYLTHSGIALALLAGCTYDHVCHRSHRDRIIASTVLGAWLLAAVICSNAQHQVWRSDGSLFEKLTSKFGAGWHWAELARIQVAQKRYPEAEQSARRAIAYEAQLDHHLAEDRKALQHLGLNCLAPIQPPTSGSNQALLGFVLMREGRKEEAVKILTAASQQSPSNQDISLQLATYYDDRYTSSHDPADRSLADLHYENASRGTLAGTETAIINRGTMWAADGQTTRALTIWAAGLTKFPVSRVLNYNAQRAYQMLEDANAPTAQTTQKE